MQNEDPQEIRDPVEAAGLNLLPPKLNWFMNLFLFLVSKYSICLHRKQMFYFSPDFAVIEIDFYSHKHKQLNYYTLLFFASSPIH